MLSTFPGFLKSFCFQSVFVLCFFHFFSSVLFYSYIVAQYRDDFSCLLFVGMGPALSDQEKYR